MINRILQICSVSICLMLVPANASSQMQGSIPVGGTAHLSFSTDDFRNTFNMWLNPKVAYYTDNSNAFGASILYNFSYSEHAGPTSRTHQVLFQPFWRKDFSKNEDFGLFIQVGPIIGYSYSKTEFTTSDVPAIQEMSLGFRGGPGLYYFITKRLSAECTIGSMYYEAKWDPTDRPSLGTRHDFVASMSLASLNIGLQYYFRKQ